MPDPEYAEAVRLYWVHSKESIQKVVKERVPGEGPGGGFTPDQKALAQRLKYEMCKRLPPAEVKARRQEARQNLGLPEPEERGTLIGDDAEARPLLRGHALAKYLATTEPPSAAATAGAVGAPPAEAEEHAQEASKKRPFTDARLSTAWTSGCGISSSQFYRERKARGVVTNIAAGRPSSGAQFTRTPQRLQKAEDDGVISARTKRKWRLLRSSKPSGDAVTRAGRHRSRLLVLFGYLNLAVNQLVVVLFIVYLIARELTRMNIDPLSDALEFKGGSVTLAQYHRILQTQNKALVKQKQCAPTMVTALQGCEKTGVKSAHTHNVHLVHDAFVKKLSAFLSRISEKGFSMQVQFQYASFAMVYNGPDILPQLQSMEPSNLPIQPHQTAPDMVKKVLAWSTALSKRKIRLFSVRYNLCHHNTLQAGGQSATRLLERCSRAVLSREDCDWYVYAKSYSAKVAFLGTKPGYRDDTSNGLLAKNLINVCHALSQQRTELAALAVTGFKDHPDGDGACAFYALMGPDATRTTLIEAAQESFPRVYHNGNVVLDIPWSMGFSEAHECTQYNSCACWRMLEYVLTGVLRFHLQRSAELGPLHIASPDVIDERSVTAMAAMLSARRCLMQSIRGERPYDDSHNNRA